MGGLIPEVTKEKKGLMSSSSFKKIPLLMPTSVNIRYKLYSISSYEAVDFSIVISSFTNAIRYDVHLGRGGETVLAYHGVKKMYALGKSGSLIKDPKFYVKGNDLIIAPDGGWGNSSFLISYKRGYYVPEQTDEDLSSASLIEIQ